MGYEGLWANRGMVKIDSKNREKIAKNHLKNVTHELKYLLVLPLEHPSKSQLMLWAWQVLF